MVANSFREVGDGIRISCERKRESQLSACEVGGLAILLSEIVVALLLLRSNRRACTTRLPSFSESDFAIGENTSILDRTRQESACTCYDKQCETQAEMSLLSVQPPSFSTPCVDLYQVHPNRPLDLVPSLLFTSIIFQIGIGKS